LDTKHANVQERWGIPGDSDDQRAQRTRDRLGRALLELMRDKEYEDIEVREIAARAGVGRSTFYTHFEDKDDLLIRQSVAFRQMMGDNIVFDARTRSWRFPVARLFEHMREVRFYYEALTRSKKLERMMKMGQIVLAETFEKRARQFSLDVSANLHAVVPFVPDSNLVCLALNPVGNRDVSRANAFVRRLYDELRCDPSQPLQLKEFFGSVTTLRPEALGEVEMRRILHALGLDPDTLGGDNDDRLLILRHTLMNPYLIDQENGISYIDRYFEFLARRTAALLALERAA